MILSEISECGSLGLPLLFSLGQLPAIAPPPEYPPGGGGSHRREKLSRLYWGERSFLGAWKEGRG